MRGDVRHPPGRLRCCWRKIASNLTSSSLLVTAAMLLVALGDRRPSSTGATCGGGLRPRGVRPAQSSCDPGGGPLGALMLAFLSDLLARDGNAAQPEVRLALGPGRRDRHSTASLGRKRCSEASSSAISAGPVPRSRRVGRYSSGGLGWCIFSRGGSTCSCWGPARSWWPVGSGHAARGPRGVPLRILSL